MYITICEIDHQSRFHAWDRVLWASALDDLEGWDSEGCGSRVQDGGHMYTHNWFMFSLVHTLSHVWLFATPWIAARQASLSITNSRSLLKFMSIESVISSSHLILCCPLLLLPSIPPSIRVFSNESALHIRWPKYSVVLYLDPENFQSKWLELASWSQINRVVRISLESSCSNGNQWSMFSQGQIVESVKRSSLRQQDLNTNKWTA